MIKLDKKGKNPLNAVHCLWQGIRWLLRKELRKYFLLPLLINIVLYSLAFMLGYHYLTDVINQLIPDWLSWLEWILWPLFFVSFLVTGFFTFTMLANLIAAPFYSLLSIKTMELLSGQKTTLEEQSWTQVFLAELIRVIYLLSRMLPLLLLFIIPVVNLIAPFLWTIFGAWGMALEYMAYPLENKGLLFSEQKQILKSGRLASLSFGGLTALGLTIPLLNLIIAPAAVIGATLYVHRFAHDPKIPFSENPG